MVRLNDSWFIAFLVLPTLLLLRVEFVTAITPNDISTSSSLSSSSSSEKTTRSNVNLRATRYSKGRERGKNANQNLRDRRVLQQQEEESVEVDEHVTLPTDNINIDLNPIDQQEKIEYDKNMQYIDEEGRTCYMLPNEENKAKKLEWKTENGELFFNDQPFHIKGISWFGFETPARMPHGLWQNDLDSILSFLKENDFNAIRLPFSVVLMHYYKDEVQWNMPLLDEYLHGKNSLQMMELIVDKAAEYDMLIMLDFHRINEQVIPELWYDQQMSTQQTIEAWDQVLNLVKGKWNVFALDLKNEPHGRATWGDGNEWTDWNLAAEKMATHILENHPEFSGFFFVEGTQQANADNIDPNPKFWGGDLEGAIKNPISFGKYGEQYKDHENRIVYSPHVYGPDVYEMQLFWSGDFPNNMPPVWHQQWAFAEKETKKAVVISEWGGHNRPGSNDEKWHEALASYMVENCLEDNFYWALNPNSGDTGGLLYDNYQDVDWKKIDLLKRVQPNPSKLSWGKDGKSVCFYEGDYANEKACNYRKYPELLQENKNGDNDNNENNEIQKGQDVNNNAQLNPIQPQVVVEQPNINDHEGKKPSSFSDILEPIPSSTLNDIPMVEEKDSLKVEEATKEKKITESVFANPKLKNPDSLYH